jgi:hypothetical protein
MSNSFGTYGPVADPTEIDYDPSTINATNFPAASFAPEPTDWETEQEWLNGMVDGDFSANYVQGITGEENGEYNLLITNNVVDRNSDQYGYGGLYFGGQYDPSHNKVSNKSAHMYSDFNNGFVIKTVMDKDISHNKTKFRIQGDLDEDSSHNLFTIDVDDSLDAYGYGYQAGGVVSLNELTYGYLDARKSDGDIDGDVPMGIHADGSLFRNYKLQNKIDKIHTDVSQHKVDISNINTNLTNLYTNVNVINQDLSGLNELLNLVAGTSGEVVKLATWLTSATRIQEAFLKTDDNINKVIAYINRLNFGPKMKYIQGQNPYQAPTLKEIDYRFDPLVNKDNVITGPQYNNKV